jgi:hypothetical protein
VSPLSQGSTLAVLEKGDILSICLLYSPGVRPIIKYVVRFIQNEDEHSGRIERKNLQQLLFK